MKKLVLAVVTAGVFMMSSCTRSDSDLVLESQSTKKESTEKLACTMNWQTKIGSTTWFSDNKTFSVVSGTSGQIYIVNDNNGTSGYSGNINVKLSNSQVDLPNSSDYDFNVPSGGTRTIIVDEFLTSTMTVSVMGLGLSPTKVFAVSVGYCL